MTIAEKKTTFGLNANWINSIIKIREGRPNLGVAFDVTTFLSGGAKGSRGLHLLFIFSPRLLMSRINTE
jgi:hypothetical protein